MKPSLVEAEMSGKDFSVRLLFVLARAKELREMGILVCGITVGDISDLASTILPHVGLGWSASILAAEQLGRLVLKQYPLLAEISLEVDETATSEERYFEKLVARAVEVCGSTELRIQPA